MKKNKLLLWISILIAILLSFLPAYLNLNDFNQFVANSTQDVPYELPPFFSYIVLASMVLIIYAALWFVTVLADLAGTKVLHLAADLNDNKNHANGLSSLLVLLYIAGTLSLFIYGNSDVLAFKLIAWLLMLVGTYIFNKRDHQDITHKENLILTTFFGVIYLFFF